MIDYMIDMPRKMWLSVQLILSLSILISVVRNKF